MFRNIKLWLNAFSRKPKVPTIRKPNYVRLRVEELETRLAPADINYLGVSSEWNTLANWPASQLPTSGDNVFLNDASSLSVATLNVPDGVQVRSLTVSSGFTVNVSGAVTVDELHQSGGTIQGAGTLYVNNLLNMTGGAMAGSGMTSLVPGATANINQMSSTSPTLAGTRTLVNNGVINWGGAFSVEPTAAINNIGTLSFTVGSFTYDAATPILNQGTLIFNDSNVNFNGPLTIAGNVSLLGTYTGTYTAADGNVTLHNLTLSGTMTGSGTFTITNTFTWQEGVLTGTGKTIVPATGTFNLPASWYRYLSGRTLTVQGQRTGPYYNSGLHVQVGGTFGNIGLPEGGPVTTAPPFSASTAAGEITRAMSGIGTDEDRLFRAMERVTSMDDVTALNVAYSQQTNGGSLYTHLFDELSGDDWKRAVALLSYNWNQYVAVTLHQHVFAVPWHKDFDWVARLLQDSRTQTSQVVTKYGIEYANVQTGALAIIDADLQANVTAPYRDRVLANLEGNSARADAAALRILVNKRAAGDSIPLERFADILSRRTPEQITAIRAEYAQLYGQNAPDALDVDLRVNRSTQECYYVNDLLTGDKILIAVRKLYLAMDGPTTDEDAVWNTLNGLYADERAMITQVYHQVYQHTLLQDIMGDFEDTYIFGKELSKTLKIYYNGGLSLAERLYFATEGMGTDDPAIRSLIPEVANLSPDRHDQFLQEYQALSGGSTAASTIYWELNGRDWFRANQVLTALPADPKLRLVAEADRLLAEYAYETAGLTNAINNGVQWTFNNHGANLDAAIATLQAARDAFDVDRENAQKQSDLVRAIANVRQNLQTFQEARDATTEIAANALATAAGMAVVIGSGGTATPVVIAIAAWAGGMTQVLTRMGLSGTFDWEQLPADYVLGAVNGGTAAFSFPAATRAAIANGTAQVGILRQIAGSSFAGGFVSSGLATALSEDNWSQGIAAGIVNMAHAAGVSGFLSTVLPGTIGAGAVLARRTLPVVRWVTTNTGIVAHNIFDPAWVRSGVQAIRNGTQNVRQYLESTLTAWATKGDEIANIVRAWAADEPESVLRQRIVAALEASGWGENRMRLMLEAAVDTANSQRSNLSSMTTATARDLMEGRAQILMMSMTDSVDALKTRMANAGISLSDEAANSVAQRLGTIQNVDDAALRQALVDTLPAGTTNIDDLVPTARDWIHSPSGLDSGLAGRGVWDIAADYDRGFRVEQVLGGRTGLPDNFPVIDQWQNGVATSIKSLDLTRQYYITNPRSFLGVFEDFIDATANFARSDDVIASGITIRPSEVVRREVVIAIPPHSVTAAQRESLDRLVQYGNARNVVVRIVELR